MEKVKNYIIIGLLIIVIGGSLFGGYYTKNLKLLHNELQRKYHSETLEYKRRLRESEQQRVLYNHRIDSITTLVRSISAHDSLTRVEIKKIKGKYNLLTNKELQDKMIEGYNNR